MEQAWSGKQTHNRIHCLDVVWMAFCGKYNTWSGAPNPHSTGFHGDALWMGQTNVSLPQIHSTTIVFPRNFNSYFGYHIFSSSGGIALNNDLIQVSKSKSNQGLCNFQIFTPDEYISVLAGALGEA